MMDIGFNLLEVSMKICMGLFMILVFSMGGCSSTSKVQSAKIDLLKAKVDRIYAMQSKKQAKRAPSSTNSKTSLREILCSYKIRNLNASSFDEFKKVFRPFNVGNYRCNYRNRTLLHSALYHAAPKETLQFLIDSGVEINAQDARGDTALHYIAFNDYFYSNPGEIAHLLIRNGAEIHAENNFYRTPLGDAAHYGHVVEVIEALLEAGADKEKGEKYRYVLPHLFWTSSCEILKKNSKLSDTYAYDLLCVNS